MSENAQSESRTKYGDRINDDHWEDDEPEGPPAWMEDTSAKDITLDVQLHEQGYQNDRKWTVHCTENGAFEVPPTLYCVHGEEAVEMDLVSEADLLEEAMVEA